jgi:predicted 3-demethylubiquinone-9 3-methyltransferase (glyoxalase superfamily)
MKKITPFLWFDSNLEQAMNFYTSIFKNSRISNVTKNNGKIFSANFELDGQEFYAINGGPRFKFTEAISFFVNCETQNEINYFWQKLSEGGEKGQCGWLKDKFGLSWQIVPTVLSKLLNDPDPVKSQRVMNAMLKMTRLDINSLKEAYEHFS